MISHLSTRLIALALLLLQLLAKHATAASTPPTGEEEKEGMTTIEIIPHEFLPAVPYKPTAFSNNKSSSSSTNHLRRQQTKNIFTSNTNTRSNTVSCGSCCYTIESASLYSNQLDLSFYAKVINTDGFLITSSQATSDHALYEAALTFDKLTVDRPDLKATLVAEGVHLTVIAQNEVITDVPEYTSLGSSWNWVRGIGATRWRPVTSCAEENLLCLNGDPYSSENICVHETAHSLQGSGGKLPTTRYVEMDNGEDLDAALRSVYTNSVTNGGLWGNTYAATNHEELWAEGVQSFYNVNTQGPFSGNGVHNSINTRAELQSYDVDLYNIISRVFPSDVSFNCPPSSCNCNSFQCPNNSVSTPAPTLAPVTASCTDRTGRWTIGTRTRNWCSWAANRNNTSKNCRRKDLYGDCPETCGVCTPSCADRTGSWTIGTRTRKWCIWASRASDPPMTRCVRKDLFNDCPVTCNECP